MVKQVPVRTTMRPGSGFMVAEEEEEEEEEVVVFCGGEQYLVVPMRLGDVLSIDLL